MRSKPVIALIAGFAIVAAVVAGMIAYDNGREDLIAEGVTVEGVDIGGLRADAARERLAQELAQPLTRPVKARFGKRTFRLTAKQARIAVDVDATVDQALERSRGGWIVSRTLRGLTGGEVDAALDLAVSYDRSAVRDLVARVSENVERDPVDADVEISTSGISPREGVAGRRLAERRLRRKVKRTLLEPAGRTVKVKVRKIKPKVTTAELADKYPSIIVVERGSFQLTLYEDLKVAETYTVAIGQTAYATPAGRYAIQNKAVDPVWSVPNSAWAGSLAGTTVPPGPSNPLKARWMGIYDGAGIHGTDATYSLGSAASHGCVRMSIPEVIELYDRVDVGTPVYIA